MSQGSTSIPPAAAAAAPSPRLVEREQELAALRDGADAAGVERGRLLLIEGVGGIGKTALLGAAAAQARERGARVLRATGRVLEQSSPFGVVRQLTEPAYLALPPERRSRVLTGAAGLLEPFLTHAELHPGTSLEHGLLWFLVGLAEDRPLMLLVDDAHLADEGSLRSLAYLAARVHELPLTLVVAHRPAADDDAASSVLPHLHATPGAVRLQPGALTRAGVGAVLAEAGLTGAASSFVDACASASGGNPLYVRELVQVVHDRGIPPTTEGGDAVRATGPVSVAEAIYLTLSRDATGRSTALVRAAAVLEEAPIAIMASLAGLAADQAAPTAAALVRDGLLREHGGALGLAHPIMRQAIRDDLQPLELAHAHAAAARLLHERGAGDDTVAAHLLASPAAGAIWACDALCAAAAEATTFGDHPTAARLLRRALDEPGDRGAVLAQLARAEAASGEPRAEQTFDAALDANDDDAHVRAELQLARGRTLMLQGRFGEATRAFGEGVDALGDDDPHLAAELRASHAGAALWDPSQGADAQAGFVREIAEFTDPSTPAERVALANLAGGMMLGGQADFATARSLALRAWDGGALLEALGPEDPTAWSVTAVLLEAEAIDEAGRVYRALRDGARAAGLAFASATASYGVALHHLRVGALADAVAESELALSAQAQGWGMYAASAHSVRALALILQGRLQEAATSLDVGPERAAALRASTDGAAYELALGSLAMVTGDPSAAAAAYRRAGDLISTIGWLPGHYDWTAPLARAQLASGDRAGGEATLATTLKLATAWGAPTGLGVALRTRALFEDGTARLATLQEAAGLLASSEAPLDRAATLVKLGETLVETGDPAAARDPLREALDLADACGAVPLATEARSALLAAGGRPRRTRLRGIDALTPGELQVVRLAAEGRTNRQIAEALFVTPKAVRWHLGNAYRKLGVSDRAALPEALGPRQHPTDPA